MCVIISDRDTNVLSDEEVASIRTEIKEIIRETIVEVLTVVLREELPRILVDVNEQTKVHLKSRGTDCKISDNFYNLHRI